jgi:hypothetical protein
VVVCDWKKRSDKRYWQVADHPEKIARRLSIMVDSGRMKKVGCGCHLEMGVRKVEG